MKLSTHQIKKLAKEKLQAAPKGLRWINLVKEISSESPETPVNAIWGSTTSLFKNDPDIEKVSKGIYAIKFSDNDEVKAQDGKPEVSVQTASGNVYSEQDFYEPFANWLRDGLDEVTEAISIGGNIFKGKWNTPDVIGVLRPLKGDLIKFEPQIISAEIKVDPSQPVTAFGQAISYRLFSHKCYLVLPSTVADDDFDRVQALAVVFGLGLVTFNLDPADPRFLLVVRATIAQPDMVYVNQMAQRLNAHDSKAFDRLF